jgi:nucleoside 2-deoxyribosyltransferase
MTKLSNKTETSNKAGISHKNRSRGNRPYTVYLAGDLWTHKDLIGNALLAKYIKSVSRGRYVCVLPQDLEEPVHRTVDIRNVDLKHVMTCDMAIFNFDGSNLDAGTVVEFIYAKMIDIPSVILRTDFRAAGEGNQEQDPWNLMATSWPRTKEVKLHGMAEYQGAKTPGQLGKTIEKLYKKMAAVIVENLDAVRQEKPLVSDPARMAAMYQWAIECPGAGYDTLFGKGEVETLLSVKKRKGLLASK